MKKRMFRCSECKTILILEISDPELDIYDSPPCICGKSVMLDMSSAEYAYGKFLNA